MKTVRRVIAGCGYLEGYGHHPGTAIMCLFIIAATAAGAHRGYTGALVGALISCGVLVPLYLAGAYGRAKEAGVE